MRAWIYDRFLLSYTTAWYREVLTRLPEGAYLLDVGIGTGGALLKNADLVREKNIRVLGVDIDGAYIERANKAIEKAGMSDLIEAKLESIYDHQGGAYDGVYFSASFMLMPDPEACLHHVVSLLSEEGRVYFTQTFQEKESKLMERLKPVLKTLTTIDFGQVTYEPDFRSTVEGCGVNISEMTEIDRSGPRSFRIVVADPEVSDPSDSADA